MLATITRRARLACLVAAAPVAFVLAGCGTAQMPSPGLARGPINELRGAYDGVPLGASLETLQNGLGVALSTNDNPYITPAQRPPFLPSDNPYDWIYPDADITFVKGHVASITVYGKGAATMRGVSIGDPLSEVPRVYKRAGCVPGNGGPEPLDPGCQVQFGPHVFVYFSGDPIHDVSLSQYTELP